MCACECARARLRVVWREALAIMGSKGGGVAGNSGISAIPAVSRKVVQSLKEIVNCPELEIYAALKDCNMDPNEAVNRLLTQGPLWFTKLSLSLQLVVLLAAGARVSLNFEIWQLGFFRLLCNKNFSFP